MSNAARSASTITPNESSTSCICGDDALICNCGQVMPAGPARIALIKWAMPRYEENIAELSASGERPEILAALKRNVARIKLILRYDELMAEARAEIAA